MVSYTRVHRPRYRCRTGVFDVFRQAVILRGFALLANLDRCFDRSQNRLVPGDNGHLHLWWQLLDLRPDRFERWPQRLQNSQPDQKTLRGAKLMGVPALESLTGLTSGQLPKTRL